MDDCSGSHCFGSGASQHLPVKLKVTLINSTGGPVELPADWECQDGWNCAGSPTVTRAAPPAMQSNSIKILHTTSHSITIEAPHSKGRLSVMTLKGKLICMQKTNTGSFLLPKASLPSGPCLVKWTGKNETLHRILFAF
jgi:hypothetical protein